MPEEPFFLFVCSHWCCVGAVSVDPSAGWHHSPDTWELCFQTKQKHTKKRAETCAAWLTNSTNKSGFHTPFWVGDQRPLLAASPMFGLRPWQAGV